MEHDLIAALATPLGSAALGVIRTSGPGCIDTVSHLTDRARELSSVPGGRMKKTHIVDPDNDIVLDEVMLGIFRAPHSYTGEELVEIYCHGSVPGIQAILDLLFRSGFRGADPGEFTQRAFLAGKVDLTRAEAVNEIVNAQTTTSHEMALQRLGGSIEKAIKDAKEELVHVMAGVAIQLDYPEEETGEIPINAAKISSILARLQELTDSYRTGRLYQEGVTVAIAGRTNAGKSSLFNAFLKEDRAIVSDIHGTTRDYIGSRVNLRGIPVELYDTAGLRETFEAIEEEGIRRTRNLVTGTDLVLYVVDGTVGVVAEDRMILAELGVSAATASPSRVIPVWNKLDHPHCRTQPEEIEFLPVSAVTMEGVEDLVAAIVDAIVPDQRVKAGAPVIDSLRQKNLLDRAVSALEEVLKGVNAQVPVDAISVDLQEALHALGEITGEVTSEDILDAVFSGFCVGK